MSVLWSTAPDEETGMVAAITDQPCPCGWPETILHIWPDGTIKRGCPSCETETDVATTADPGVTCRDCAEGKHGACIGSAFVETEDEIAEVGCACEERKHG